MRLILWVWWLIRWLSSKESLKLLVAVRNFTRFRSWDKFKMLLDRLRQWNIFRIVLRKCDSNTILYCSIRRFCSGNLSLRHSLFVECESLCDFRPAFEISFDIEISGKILCGTFRSNSQKRKHLEFQYETFNFQMSIKPGSTLSTIFPLNF